MAILYTVRLNKTSATQKEGEDINICEEDITQKGIHRDIGGHRQSSCWVLPAEHLGPNTGWCDDAFSLKGGTLRYTKIVTAYRRYCSHYGPLCLEKKRGGT